MTDTEGSVKSCTCEQCVNCCKARHMIPCKNHALDSTIISNQEDQEVERNKVVKALQGILIIMSKNHTQKCQKIQDYQKSIGELQDWIREYIGGHR